MLLVPDHSVAGLQVRVSGAAMGVALCLASVGSAVQALPINPSEIGYMDPLGGGCYQYQPADFETPFGDGKGLRSEPLCLPDPCEGAITRAELSRDIIGRPATDGEWNTYYARYAETCRAEAFRPGLLAGGPGVPFWEPIVETGLTPPITANVTPPPVGPLTATSLGTPVVFSVPSTPPITADDTSLLTPTTTPEVDGDLTATPPPPPQIAPISLPGTFGLLLSALALIGLRRR